MDPFLEVNTFENMKERRGWKIREKQRWKKKGKSTEGKNKRFSDNNRQ